MVNFVELGKFLYKRRCMLKYTQEEVAAIINISDRTLRNIEYGITGAALETILMLWDLYDLPAEDIFLYYSRDEVMNEMKKLYQNIKKQKISTGKK